jgi:hypothetical protein
MLKDFNVFGYDTLIKNGTDFVGLKGKSVEELKKGMDVELESDFRNPLPSGFRYGEKVTIIGFREPFTSESGGDIILVSNKRSEVWFSPLSIQKDLKSDNEKI